MRQLRIPPKLVLLSTVVVFVSLLALEQGAADPVELLRSGTPGQVRRELPAIRQAMQFDAFHWTPLMRAAAENPHPETVEMLLSQGEKRDARSLDDWNALMFAAAFNPNPAVMRVLLEAGGDPDGRTRDAWVAGYGAARYTGRIVQLDSLGFELDLSGDAESERGWTPLFFAARYNREPQVAAELLAAGADQDLRDEYGRTALDYARESGRQDVVGVLERAAGGAAGGAAGASE